MPIDAGLQAALTDTATTLFERHLANAREWFPHEYVPWSQGRDFEPGYEWEPSEAPMDEAVRSALFVNLLTEDNLPYYFWTIDRTFGGDADDVWGAWTRRWTAEEGRHSIVIRDYLTITRMLDPVTLERGRMVQVSKGQVPMFDSVPEGLTYVALQELATRISHTNTGRLMNDPLGHKIMGRVAGDENLHHNFYRDMVLALIAHDPSVAVLAMERTVSNFAMPGQGIPGFESLSRAIAKVGIYDFAVHHDQILEPLVLGTWGLEEIAGLSSEAEEARDRCLAYIGRVGRIGRQLVEKRERDEARDEVHDGVGAPR